MPLRRVVALVVAATFLLSLPAWAAQEEVEAQPRLQAILKDVEASFGPEAWKYNPDYVRNGFAGPNEMQQHIQNVTASYFSALGYKVRLHVQIVELASGNPVADPNLNLTAYIDAPQGRLDPFILRHDASSSEFYLDFDVDGSFIGGPGGENLWPLAPGFQTVHVAIVDRGAVPTSPPIPRGENTITFVYDRPTVEIHVPDLPRPSQRQLPDGMFRLFNDLGYGDAVTAIDLPVSVDTNVTLTYRYNYATEQPVVLTAFVAYRGVPGEGVPLPAGLTPPNIPGVTDDPAVQSALSTANTLVHVEATQIGEAVTDGAGRVAFSFIPADVVGQDAAIVLFAAQLKETHVPPGQSLGGPDVVVGASEALLPLVRPSQLNDPPTVASFSLRGPGLSAQEEMRLLNQLEVRIIDPHGATAGAGTRGDLFAVEDPGSGVQLLSSGALNRDADPQRQDRHRVGQIPSAPIQEALVTKYRVYGVLYRDDDSFYTLTYADRGFQVDALAAPIAYIGQRGVFYVNISSWNTNYDDTPDEPSFLLTVRVHVSNADLDINETHDLEIPEAGRQSVQVVASSPSVGDFPMRVSAYSADTRTGDMEASLRFVRPPPEKGFIERIPAIEVAAALAAMTLALLWAGRTRP